MSVLDAACREQIQDAYRQWLGARGFKPRRGQREMVATIARVLGALDEDVNRADGEHVAVVEAGTGTGKTAAYLLAAVPVARALGKRLVLATATVALQEQVTHRDIPDLLERSGLAFSVALAKGRRRYLCLQRLDRQLASAEGADDGTLALFSPEAGSAAADETSEMQVMLQAFGEQSWDGDLDAWPRALPDGLAGRVTTDHRGCTGARCSWIRQCPFFRARERLEGVEVVVANHDLVLSDLALGGGAVLPEPEETLYIFDEGHHLPAKAQGHLRHSARVRGGRAWLEQVTAMLGTASQVFGRPEELTALARRAAVDTLAVAEQLSEVLPLLEDLPFQGDGQFAPPRHRFAHGVVPEALASAAQALAAGHERLAALLSDAVDELSACADGRSDWGSPGQAVDVLPLASGHLARAQAGAALWHDLARAAIPVADLAAPPRARWVTRLDPGPEAAPGTPGDVELSSSPLLAAPDLRALLWERACGVVVTSATLTALGGFERFLFEAGIGPAATCLSIPSPFDYPRLASLEIPAMRSDAGDQAAHTDELVELLPRLLADDRAALVLFMSWRQMRRVLEGLPESLHRQVLVQGELSKQEILRSHCAAVDAGERSVIFGLASFAEGIDLPGQYLEHVLVAKLPFSVPDDPVAAGLAEWLEASGRNPFMELSVPEAALRLKQAVGRLVRSETDSGRVTILDRRLLTRRYGRALLDALPPFRREFG